MPEPLRPVPPPVRPVDPADRGGATAIVRGEGWAWLLQFLLTQMAHWDRWGSDPHQTDALRHDALGRRQAYKELLTTLYHYAGVPNPLEHLGAGVWLPRERPVVPPEETPADPAPPVETVVPPWRERRTSGPVA